MKANHHLLIGIIVFSLTGLTNYSSQQAKGSAGLFRHHYITQDMPKDEGHGSGTQWRTSP